MMWEDMPVHDSKDSNEIVTVKCRTMPVQQRVKVKAVTDVVLRGRVKAKVREVETEVTTMVEMMILKSKSPHRWLVTSLRMIQKSMPPHWQRMDATTPPTKSMPPKRMAVTKMILWQVNLPVPQLEPHLY